MAIRKLFFRWRRSFPFSNKPTSVSFSNKPISVSGLLTQPSPAAQQPRVAHTAQPSSPAVQQPSPAQPSPAHSPAYSPAYSPSQPIPAPSPAQPSQPSRRLAHNTAHPASPSQFSPAAGRGGEAQPSPPHPPAQPSPAQPPAQPSPAFTLPSTQPQMQNVVPKKNWPKRFAQIFRPKRYWHANP